MTPCAPSSAVYTVNFSRSNSSDSSSIASGSFSMMRTDCFTSSLLRSIGWRAARLYAPGHEAVKETRSTSSLRLPGRQGGSGRRLQFARLAHHLLDLGDVLL